MPEATPSVYVIAAPEIGPGRVKIGWTSRHPTERLADLQTGSPTTLRLVFWTEGNEATERILHALFAARRLHGEWFEFGEEDPVARVVEAVQLLRLAVEPYDPNCRRVLPLAEDPAQQRYEDHRDAMIAALITYGAMGKRATARYAGVPDSTGRRALNRMQFEGILTVAKPDSVSERHDVITLNPDHPAVATLLA